MAIAADARTAGTQKALAVGADSFTWSHTTSGADRILEIFVTLAGANSGTVDSVTYNSVALTQFGTVSLTTIGNGVDLVMRAYLFYLIAPATGANTVVVNCTTGSGGGYGMGSGMSHTGVHQTTAWNAAGPHTQNTANAQPSITVTSAADEWPVGVWSGVTNPAPTTTAGAGQTEIGDAYNATHFMYHVSCDEDASGASTVLDYTGLTLDAGWGVGGVAGSLMPAGGAGGGQPTGRRFALTQYAASQRTLEVGRETVSVMRQWTRRASGIVVPDISFTRKAA
jgi:hypothetical protein